MGDETQNIPIDTNKSINYTNNSIKKPFYKNKWAILLTILIIILIILGQLYLNKFLVNYAAEELEKSIIPILNNYGEINGEKSNYSDLEKIKSESEKANEKVLQNLRLLEKNQPINIFVNTRVCERQGIKKEVHDFNSEDFCDNEGNFECINCGEYYYKEITLTPGHEAIYELLSQSVLLELSNKILFNYEENKVDNPKTLTPIKASAMHILLQVARTTMAWAHISPLKRQKGDYGEGIQEYVNWSENTNEKIKLLKEYINELPNYSSSDIDNINVAEICTQIVENIKKSERGIALQSIKPTEALLVIKPKMKDICKKFEILEKKYTKSLIQTLETEENFFLVWQHKIYLDNFINCYKDISGFSEDRDFSCHNNIERKRTIEFVKKFNVDSKLYYNSEV